MSKVINDLFSTIRSTVRFNLTANIRFLAEELRRYGIKTNQKTEKDKTIFFQSAHILLKYPEAAEESQSPELTLVSFKDLFKLIGKNEGGVDDQDIVRVWEIASKLEKRSIIEITGTASELLEKDEEPNIPDVYANLCHIHRNDEHADNYVYKSKFATGKVYKTTDNKKLIGVSDFFIID
jgi:hypothetical protein